MTPLVWSAMASVIIALGVGILLGFAAQKSRAVRYLVEVLTQYRVGLGFWFLAIWGLEREILSTPLVLAVTAGCLQAVMVARLLYSPGEDWQPERARLLASASLGRSMLRTGERIRGAVMGCATLASLQVLLLLRVLDPSGFPSPAVAGLGLLPLVVVLEPALRRALTRVPN